MELESLILAAGLGTRMHSRLPKALHPLGGRPLIRWVVDACKHATGKPPFVVIGPEMGAIRAVVPEAAGFVEQTQRLGTGHAVLVARTASAESFARRTAGLRRSSRRSTPPRSRCGRVSSTSEPTYSMPPGFGS